MKYRFITGGSLNWVEKQFISPNKDEYKSTEWDLIIFEDDMISYIIVEDIDGGFIVAQLEVDTNNYKQLTCLCGYAHTSEEANRNLTYHKQHCVKKEN